MRGEEIAMTLAGVFFLGFIVWSLSRRQSVPVLAPAVVAPALTVARPRPAMWFSAAVQPQTSAQRQAPSDCGCGG